MTGTQDGPLGYFITFTTHGARLHGNPRGSIDVAHNAYDSPGLAPSPSRVEYEQFYCMKGTPVVLGPSDRAVVDGAIRALAQRRGWDLLAINVRSNHVHAIVATRERAEQLMTGMKAWATRALCEAKVVVRGQWARHGSTRYVWRERDLERVCDYVVHGQERMGQDELSPTSVAPGARTLPAGRGSEHVRGQA